MKCFEVTQCSEQDRESCYVWNTLGSDPQKLENIKCWVMKSIYQQDNKEQFDKCQKCQYYIQINQNTKISKLDNEMALISCEGEINNIRAKVLETVWAKLKENNRFTVLVDLSKADGCYSCGLGILVKMHKESTEAEGMVVLIGVQDTVRKVIQKTQLDSVFHFAPTREDALEYFEEIRRRKEEETRAAEEAERRKRGIPCWEYWEDHNPRNATVCDECFRKLNPKDVPCWVVDGLIEGVSFQYVSEDCEDCDYFLEYGNIPAQQLGEKEENQQT